MALSPEEKRAMIAATYDAAKVMVDDLEHVLGADLVGEGGLSWSREHEDTAGLVAHQQALQQRHVQAAAMEILAAEAMPARVE